MTLIPQLLRDGESRSGLASIERRVAVAGVATAGAAGWELERPRRAAAGGGVQRHGERDVAVGEGLFHPRRMP